MASESPDGGTRGRYDASKRSSEHNDQAVKQSDIRDEPLPPPRKKHKAAHTSEDELSGLSSPLSSERGTPSPMSKVSSNKIAQDQSNIATSSGSKSTTSKDTFTASPTSRASRKKHDPKNETVLPGMVTGAKREALLKAMPPAFGYRDSSFKTTDTPEYPEQTIQNALGISEREFMAMAQVPPTKATEFAFQLSDEQLDQDLIAMGVLKADGSRKDATAKHLQPAEVRHMIRSHMTPYRIAAKLVFQELINDIATLYEAEGVVFDINDKTCLPRAKAELIAISQRGHKQNDVPTNCEPHVAFAEIIWDLVQSGKCLDTGIFNYHDLKRRGVVSPDYQPAANWATEFNTYGVEFPVQPGTANASTKVGIAPAILQAAKPKAVGAPVLAAPVESQPPSTPACAGGSSPPVSIAQAIADRDAGITAPARQLFGRYATASPFERATSAISPLLPDIQVPTYVPPAPVARPVFTPVSQYTKLGRPAAASDDVFMTGTRDEVSDSVEQSSASLDSSEKKRRNDDALLPPASIKRTKLTPTTPAPVETPTLRRSSRASRQSSKALSYGEQSDEEPSPLKRKSASRGTAKKTARSKFPATPIKDEGDDSFDTPVTKGKSGGEAAVPADFKGIPSMHGYSANKPANAELDRPWQCGDISCASGFSWLVWDVDEKTGKKPKDKSLARKTTSHFFGRNQAATKLIPGPVWHLMCRKHYQHDRYHMEKEPKESKEVKESKDRKKLIAWQLEYIRIQLLRLKLWRPEATFRVTLTTRATTRYQLFTEVLQQPGKTRQDAIEHTLGDPKRFEEKYTPATTPNSDDYFPMDLLEYFRINFNKNQQTYDDIEQVLVWMDKQVENGNTDWQCPMQFLLNPAIEGETVNDPKYNYQQWECHIAGEEFDLATAYEPGYEASDEAN